MTPELYEQLLASACSGIVGDPYTAGKELVDLRLEVAQLRHDVGASLAERVAALSLDDLEQHVAPDLTQPGEGPWTSGRDPTSDRYPWYAFAEGHAAFHANTEREAIAVCAALNWVAKEKGTPTPDPTFNDEPPWRGWFSCEGCYGWFNDEGNAYDDGTVLCDACAKERDAEAAARPAPVPPNVPAGTIDADAIVARGAVDVGGAASPREAPQTTHDSLRRIVAALDEADCTRMFAHGGRAVMGTGPDFAKFKAALNTLLSEAADRASLSSPTREPAT